MRQRISLEDTRPYWMWLTILLGAAIALSWIPALGLPLGDDHQGRILGRLLLHAENLLDHGWAGSNLGAAWEPYASSPYAHHPPLPNLLQFGVAWAQGGTTAFGARLIGTVGGIFAVAGVGALVRKLTGSWFATAVAMAGLAISGYFWFFGRGISLVFPVVYFLIRCYAPERPGRHWLVAGFAVGALGALQSWVAAFIIGLVALYDLATGDRAPALAAGAGVALGLGLDFLWMESAAGIGALFAHLESRAASADYSLLDWVFRQGGFYLRFESLPVFVITALALAAGLRDRRFRPLVGSVFASVVVFAVVFDQNAWVHEYWNWRIALVLSLGLGAAGAWLADRRIPGWGRNLAIVLLAGATLVPVARLGTDMYEIQFSTSSQAGELLERNPFPTGQTVAWYHGPIAGPRWYSWYTDLPVAAFDPERSIDPEALVLVKVEGGNAPGDWDPVDSEGPYYLVEAGELAALLDGQS